MKKTIIIFSISIGVTPTTNGLLTVRHGSLPKRHVRYGNISVLRTAWVIPSSMVTPTACYQSQYPEVEAFIDKFLLGKNVMTNYEIVDKVIQK